MASAKSHSGQAGRAGEAAGPSAAHWESARAVIARYCWHTAPLAPEDIIDPTQPYEAWASELPGHRVEGGTPGAALEQAMQSAERVAAISLALGRTLPTPICDQGRSEQVNIKLSARELASIRDESRRQGKSVSEWARERLTTQPG
jgi:hypothetical protein